MQTLHAGSSTKDRAKQIDDKRFKRLAAFPLCNLRSTVASILLRRFGLFGLCLQLGCSDPNHARKVELQITPRVKIAIASETNIPLQLTATGRVSAFSSVLIRSQVDGILKDVHFQEGEVVNAGELLFTIDPAPFEVALKRAKGDLERDIALEKSAEIEQRVNEVLLRSKVISKENYDQSESAADSLKSTLKADEAMVEAAQLGLSNCYIHSPITGRAGLLQVTKGNLIYEPDIVLVCINQTRPIYIDISIPESELPGVRERFSAERLNVEAYLPGQPNPCAFGNVAFINNQVDPNTGTILVRARFDNENEFLWPGETFRTVLTLSEWTNTVTIPSQAVQTDSRGRYAFVINGDLILERRPLEPGSLVLGDRTLVNNVKAGEQVVIASPDVLARGMRVTVE